MQCGTGSTGKFLQVKLSEQETRKQLCTVGGKRAMRFAEGG